MPSKARADKEVSLHVSLPQLCIRSGRVHYAISDERRISLAYSVGPRCSLKTDVDLTTLLAFSMSIL